MQFSYFRQKLYISYYIELKNRDQNYKHNKHCINKKNYFFKE